jgi:hypothetical protein
MEQPSEQKSIGIDELLNKLRGAYEDSSRTKCEACRQVFSNVARMCLNKEHSVSKLRFPSIRRGRSFLNCQECNSKFELNHKAKRAEDLKTKRFDESFKLNHQIVLEQHETLSGTISFPVAVYNGR